MVTAIGSGLQQPSAFGLGALGRIQQIRSTLFQQISTGSRLVNAATDAAAFSVANVLGARIRSLATGSFNVQQGVSLVQTAEGGLSQIQANVLRIQELATQAANDTLGSQERQAIQEEINQITTQINQTATSTRFAGQSLLDGTLPGPVVLETGEATAAPPTITPPTATTAALGLNTLDVSTREGALAAITATQQATTTVATARGALGATQRGLYATAQRVQQAALNLGEALSRIEDVDVARATAQATALRVREQASLAVGSQAFVSRGGVFRLVVPSGYEGTVSPRSGTFAFSPGSNGVTAYFMPFLTI